ncbi:hypothetical protein QGN29_04265 [Temperatibacter marinus]|uniref:Uncharacterized protein n=1 Tax=Temperatibacter marinus TaxID=1456591 RepID=A0AA52EDQ8_9PROT|nr:hypothetical protein [Temperatibacter marinus]WND03587.1 hypothetical protein QGN29_04265 [Temperatibacter marinus]
MWSTTIILTAIIYISTITYISYRLGMRKTEDANRAALIGFFLAFLPPFALIYLVILFFKEEEGIV